MRPRVVIVGAGFAGLECAKALAGKPVEVTVVDRNNFHTFSPLLYQVATSALAATDVVFPVRGILRHAPNLTFRNASVTGVDWGGRTVALDQGDPLAFDHLVVAAGAVTNFLGVPGAEEHGLPLYVLADATRLRHHILEQFERVDAEPEGAETGDLTVVVVGGGPTGVETAGALAELFHNVLAQDFPHLDLARARVVLVEATDRLLGSFSTTASDHARSQLLDLGVELRLGQAVAEVTAEAVVLASGEVVPTRTLVWAAGVRANPLADVLGLPRAAGGRIPVDATLRPAGRPEVFVVGDLAAITDGRGRTLPQLAPVARRSGHCAGVAIARLAEGRRVGRFRYLDKGTMATIGRHAAVADLPFGIHLTGFLGWLAWLFLHLMYLAGFRNRLSVFVNWAWSWLTYDRGPRMILPPDR